MAEATITVEEISAQAGAKAMLVTITGQLDESNVDEKSKEVYKLFEENEGKLSLVFDLAGLDYMNSKSIGYLTDWYGKIKEKGGEVAISRAKPNIADILQVVGLTQLIKSYESVDEAKQAVLQSAGEPAVATPATPEAPVAAPEAPTPVAPVETPATQEAPAAEPEAAPEAPAEAPTEAPETPQAEIPAPTPEQPAAPEAPTPVAPVETPATPEAPAPAETPAEPAAPATTAVEGTDTYDLNAK
ncbi:anti-sigma factor antagonist [Candidatus Peregrinibacteria bacterium]|nr:anti-sigma factor antagonist [Candidatus Peregrinibacteria bacterium]MBT4148301.1 anti-sigma factor antagonist [Candidatus Peregrinibacteria bacterium]MBT4366438.1 anti-sigma factor antagonist [Candidatus Peregrinibacteria bacterium]